VRWAIAIFLSAGAIAIYHALVLREDQAQRASSAATVESAAPARRRDVVLLAPVEAAELATALAAIPGVRLQRWQPLETSDATAPTAEQIARVRDAIAAADADRMLVLDDGQGY